MGELEDDSAPAMSIGVATERMDGVKLTLSGLIHPEGTTTDQVETIFEIIEDIVVNDLDGRVADITLVHNSTVCPDGRIIDHHRYTITREQYEGAIPD